MHLKLLLENNKKFFFFFSFSAQRGPRRAETGSARLASRAQAAPRP
jgi:hypothetical protein